MNPGESLVRKEARKRDQQLKPETRWQWIQEAIIWTDAQRPISRATPEACKTNERKHLGKSDISFKG